MSRYIDAEALTAEFHRLTLGENSLIERLFADGVYAVIDTIKIKLLEFLINKEYNENKKGDGESK